MGTWNAYGNEYWPADYLIDAKGQVRYAAVRRGRLRQDRNRDPRAARRSRRTRSAARATRPMWSCPARKPRPRPISGTAARAGLDQRPQSPGCTTTAPGTAGQLGSSTTSPTAAPGRSPRQPARRRPQRRDRRGVRGQERLSRAELARRTPAAGAGAARRAADPRRRRRRRRARRRRHRPPPAPVHARLASAATNSTACRCASRPGVTGYAFTFG